MATSLTVTSQLSEVGSKALHGLTCIVRHLIGTQVMQYKWATPESA